MIGGMGPDDAPDGSFGGDFGGNVDGGASTAGQGHPGNRGRGRGRGRGGPAMGYSQGYNADPYGEFGFQGPQVDTFGGMYGAQRGRGQSPGNPGLANVMANANPGRGLARGNPGMPSVQRDAGWVPGQTLTDKYGQPVRLDNLAFERDDLLNDENYAAWAKQNPDKVRNTPGMLGGLLNSLGLHDLTGAMTPKENAFEDSRWGGGVSDGPQQDLIRRAMHQRALSQEGGDNYDGRYERRNPRAYNEFEGGDNPF